MSLVETIESRYLILIVNRSNVASKPNVILSTISICLKVYLYCSDYDAKKSILIQKSHI